MLHRLTAAALIAAIAQPANADTLVTNVNGIKVDTAGTIQRFKALVVTDDGKVRMTIERPELVRIAGITRTLDGGGRTLMPGLIDAHGHVMGLGNLSLQLDLVGVRSLDELKSRLAAYAKANPGGSWIIGRGWNNELWTDRKFPTAADIDSVVGDRPVWLTRVDGHASVANSAAMRAAGVTKATRAPTGGEIIDGLFVDAAESLVTPRIPEPTAATRARALVAAQQALLAVGLVGTTDMGTSAKEWRVMRTAAATGQLKMRVVAYASGIEQWRAINGGRPTPWLFGDRLRLAGTKLYTDGALGSRGAYLKAPYHDRRDTRGLRFLTDAQLFAQANAVARGGGQLAIHAIGDAANAQVITAFERLARTYGPDRRWRIEHLQVADPADLSRLKPAGIVASMQPTHQTSDRTMAEARLGQRRLAGAYAWNTIRKLGVPLAFGSDYPVESPNPFPGLSAAVSRQDPDGNPPGGWRPWERLTFGQALHAFTRGAAYAEFADEKLGCLDPGCQADFIIIDRDPTKVDQHSLAATKVLETWIGGKREFSAAGSPAQ